MSSWGKHTIYLSDLSISVFLGVEEQERASAQQIQLSIALLIDVKNCVKTDHIDDTVNYDLIVNKIIAHVRSQSWCLLERLSWSVGQMLLSHEFIIGARVGIQKPAALAGVAKVSVTFEQGMADHVSK